METTDVREYLLDYIAHADNEKVQAIYTLVKEEVQAMKPIPEEQLQMIIEARERHSRGESSSVPWEEVIRKLRNGVRNNTA